MKDKAISVLVVEDDKTLQDVYVMILSSQGFKVSSASNGVLAFEEINKFVPDVILLDYFMPVMDGKTFLMNFDSAKYPNIKIIVATNVSEQSVLDEMISLGADSYVLKSKLSPGEIIDVIQSAAGN